MIKFDKVSKKFGQNPVLEDIDFLIDSGEMVFLTGPSGSGKTTLIKLIVKEIQPTSGKIVVNDLELDHLKETDLLNLRRHIGMVFQDFRLLFDRTVGENVALALEVIGEPEKTFPERVKEVLDLVDLEEKIDYFPSQLAGGELQRACLARAMVAQPEILIADEPTGNLDIATSWQIMNLFKKINQMGKTVLIATHNVEIVDSFDKRVLEIDRGRIVRDEKKGRYRVK